MGLSFARTDWMLVPCALFQRKRGRGFRSERRPQESKNVDFSNVSVEKFPFFNVSVEKSDFLRKDLYRRERKSSRMGGELRSDEWSIPRIWLTLRIDAFSRDHSKTGAGYAVLSLFVVIGKSNTSI